MSRVSAPESRETWDPGPYRYPESNLPGIPRQQKSPCADQHGGCGHSIGARGSTRDLLEMGFRARPAYYTPRCGSALTGAQLLAVASDRSWSPLAFIRFRNLRPFHGLSTARAPNRYNTCCIQRAPHKSGHSNASCICWRVSDPDSLVCSHRKTAAYGGRSASTTKSHRRDMECHRSFQHHPLSAQSFWLLIGRQRLGTFIK